MHVIEARNVNDALSRGISYLLTHGITEDSRNGPVIVAPGPVCTVYERPRERVLFSALRDANPFFHLIGDALWCLSGSDDIEWPSYLNKRYADYSDNGDTQHGAYGNRWMNHFSLNAVTKANVNADRYDQLGAIIVELREKPGSRQAVLTMWDPEVDLRRVGKDVPCNTQVYFDARGGKLNMTVLCRSNDIIWGAYGANVVQFSVLQEWIAAAVGIPVGVYRQFSNNYHVYTNVYDREKLEAMALDCWGDAELYDSFPAFDSDTTPIMSEDVAVWRQDLRDFMRDPTGTPTNIFARYSDDFFNDVAAPMYMAWTAHKAKDYPTALREADNIAPPDWRIACQQWLARRAAKQEVRDGQL